MNRILMIAAGLVLASPGQARDEPVIEAMQEYMEFAAYSEGSISTEQLASVGTGEVFFVDARSRTQYDAGHIPGAVNLFLGGNLENGCYRSPDALRARFTPAVDAAGGAAAIVHSCGSGVSALHNMIAMERAGLGGSRLYVGSWSEWIRDPSRDVARGDNNANPGTADG